MKHTTKRRLAALSLTAALLTILAGCSVETATYEQKTYETAAGEVNSLVLEVRDRKVELVPSEDDRLHISYSESEKEFYAIDLSEDKTLTMASADSKEWGDYVGGKTAQENRVIRVSIPDGALKNLTLTTTNEDISVSRLSFNGAVDIGSNGGNIALEKLDVGTALKLDVKNGNITGSLAGAYGDFAITSTVKKGESNLPEHKEDGAKELTVSANNGDISLEFSN